MKIEIRSDCVVLDGYVNAVGRDSRVITTPNGKFVEQIVPGTFKKAIERATNVDLLINHGRKIGSTKDGQVEIFEDNIGLRAICTVRDAEVMEKARQNKLKGWSFGMHVLGIPKMEKRAEAEDVPRRYVDDIELEEISIIDDQMVPVYFGTSVEVRAEQDVLKETRSIDFVAKIQNDSKANVDYSDYESRIQKLKK